MGFSPTFGARRFPKGNEGKRVSSGYNRRRRLATRSSGKQQAERTAVRTAPIVCPEESPLVRPQAHISCRGGLTRRLRRGRWGCRPEGGSTFFRSERKYQRKPAARRLRRRPAPLRVAGFGLREPFGLSSTSVRCAHPPGKRLLLPILPAGLATSRASKWRVISCAYARSCARLFPPSKWAGLFPFAAYRRSAPPQVAPGRLNQCVLGCFGAAWVVSQRKTADLVFALRLV